MKITKLKLFSLFFVPLFAMALFSCSSGNKFKLSGQLLNMDQGDILVYSTTKLFSGFDTIHIQAGRFNYEKRIENKGTIVLVFPNFSEVPVFAEPGEDVTLKGNAQQLKVITINGTKDNEIFTRFRTQTKDLTPPNVKKAAEEFIKKNTESNASVWLLEKHYIKTENPDYKKAFSLAKLLNKSQPDNALLGSLIISLENFKKINKKGKLPNFSIKDIDGKTIDNNTIKGRKTIIYTSASWDYSNNIDYSLKPYIEDKIKKINAIKICIDPYKNKIAKDMEYMDTKPFIVCDEKMFDSPLMKTFCFTNTGENIIVDEKVNIVERNIKTADLEKYLK